MYYVKAYKKHQFFAAKILIIFCSIPVLFYQKNSSKNNLLATAYWYPLWRFLGAKWYPLWRFLGAKWYPLWR